MSDQKNTGSTQYGGQAVIEGVMMRGIKYYAVACRRSNNEIVVKQESIDSVMKKFQWLNKPFLRGTLVLIDSLLLGMKTLMFSANIQFEDIDREEKAKKGITEQNDNNKDAANQKVNDIRVAGSMFLGLAMGVLIFIAGPNLLADLLEKHINNSIIMNIIEGIVKILIFIIYIFLVSKMKDIQRVFMYHGAEHKVINTLESGHELTAENIAKYGTVHKRCGTSFIMVVLILSIFIHFFVGWSSVWYLRILARLALLPIIAGIAYEVIKFAGRHSESKIFNILLAPGLWMQNITTREPTDDQIEVALVALNSVMKQDNETISA